ncbi:MAG TPA: hypothetical protein VF403_10955, partial [Kofleriaceae bacterium]
MSSRVWVLLLVAACADVPTPPQFDGPGLVVSTDSIGTHVDSYNSNIFSFIFSATGAKLPIYLTANGEDYLGTSTACAADSGVGFTIAPALTVAGGSPASTSMLTVIDPGPGVVKVRVAFNSAYSCPTATAIIGTSDFTIFPSGRIVREDSVTPTTQELTPSATCGCASAQQNFTFSSAWTFDGAGATQVQEDNSAVAPDVFLACTMYGATHPGLGVSFANITGSHTRFHTGATATHAIDFDADATSLATDTKPMTSALQIGAATETCHQLLVPLVDVPLQIGAQTYAYTDHDGVYRDVNGGAHTAAFDIVATTKPVPPGFAVSVDLGGADHATIVKTPDPGVAVGVP